MPRGHLPGLGLVACVIVAMLAGCETIDTRIQERQAAFDAFPEEVRERLRAGRLEVGDTRDAVHIVLGAPDERRRRTTAEGTIERWIYKRYFTRSEGWQQVGYRRVLLRAADGRIVGVHYHPVHAEVRVTDEEDRVVVELAGGRVVTIEEVEG